MRNSKFKLYFFTRFNTCKVLLTGIQIIYRIN